jgi:hypothetical protein
MRKTCVRGSWGAWRRPGTRSLLAAVVFWISGCDQSKEQALPFDASFVWGEVGLSPGQFSYPRCIDAMDGDVWIIDKHARVQRLDARTGQVRGGWRMPDWENGKPTGITLWTPPAGGAMRVFIPDTHYHRIMVYDPDGASTPDQIMDGHGLLVAKFGSYGEGDGQFIYPTDVALLPTRDGRGIARLYVSEYGGNDRISVFEPVPGQVPGDERAFEFRFAFGKFGSGPGVEFNRPQSMAIDTGRGELIVADACNHRLGRFDLDGRLIAWIGGMGRERGRMLYPYGLAVLPGGHVAVAEFGNNRVQIFDIEKSESVAVHGRAGRLAGELTTPWGVALLNDDRTLLVLDSGNNRVQGVRVRGQWWSGRRSSGGGT